MADRSKKRARTASSTDKPNSVTEVSRADQLPALLATLDNKTVRDILLHVATKNSKVATLNSSRFIEYCELDTDEF